MSIIINYVNSIFERLPQSPEMFKLKQEMLSNMENRYTQLIAENKSEQQAVAKAIAEFGNTDELLAMASLPTEEREPDENTLNWSNDEVEEFKAHRSKFGLAIAFGIFLILIAPALSLLIQEMARFLPFISALESSLLILFSLIPLLVLIAVAIGLFITFGIKEQQFGIEGKVISIDSITQSNLAKELKEFKPQFAKGITFGVLFCIAGLVSLLVPLLLFSSEQFWPLIFLLSFVSIGVFLFVFFGIIHSTYDKLLSIGDYTPKRVASERLTTKVANIVFPLAVGIYVISGLLFDTWSPGWMIFPILGISFGLFAAIVENSNLFHPKK
ncbi:permease prefix domain 1-containing protein [Carnobacterium funditum]|uniref:permease prefix domain 1-containing protein n=1 Tax=Carnobacterium funditum TaxID=2752 RepID=UPI0005543938|nr:permease prefix domain 1-containing protein [Carnobacterium funditum]